LTAIGVGIYFTTRENLYSAVDRGLQERATFMQTMRPPDGDGPWGRGHGRGPGDDGPGGPGRGGHPGDGEGFVTGDGGPGGGFRVQGSAGGPDTGSQAGPQQKFMSIGPMDRDLAIQEGIDPKQLDEIRAQSQALRPRILQLDGKDDRDPTAKPWDWTAFEAAKKGKTVFSYVRISDLPFRLVSVPLKRNGKIDQIGQFAAPLSAIDRQLRGLANTLVVVFPIAILVMLAAGVVLTRRALQPVTEIASAAERIEATNLSGRLEVQGQDEFGHLSETFNTMLARLEGTFKEKDEAYARLRQFTSDASHELKTPLTAIRVRTGVALARDLEPAKYKHHLEAIDRAATLMTAVVQDLLFLARSDEGRLELHFSATPACELIMDAVSSVDVSKHRIETHAPSSMDIQGDRSALTRVLVNLLENAVRHTPEDGVIEVRAEVVGDMHRFTVRDEGVGIPAEHVPLVFERFHRVDSSRDREVGGSGLGLAIAKAIVEAHGGRISLVSEAGVGTMVILEIPAALGGPPGRSL